MLLIILVSAFITSISPHFLNVSNLLRTTSDFMEIGIMVLPMVFIIISGNIDLSIASILGLSASLMGWLYMGGWNIWLARNCNGPQWRDRDSLAPLENELLCPAHNRLLRRRDGRGRRQRPSAGTFLRHCHRHAFGRR